MTAAGRASSLIAARAATFAIAVGLAVAATFVTTAPAYAHGTGGPQPTNYETVVDGLTPAVPGIEVTTSADDQSLELTNHTPDDVVVLGYQREPYLRIGPGGVWQNRRSPAVFLNRSFTPRADPPPAFDAKASPEWVQISNKPFARWHDHRTHWMGTDPPVGVQRDSSKRQVVIRNWRVPVRLDSRRLAIVGDALWVPGPTPWPSLLGAVGLALVVLLGARRNWRASVGAALTVLLVAEVVHVAGAWAGSEAGQWTRFTESIYVIGGIAVTGLALGWLLRRGSWAAAPLVLVAGTFVFVAGGIADLSTLTRSQLITGLPASMDRLTVVLALGLGGGLGLAAAIRLRAPRQPATSRRRVAAS